jgi:glycosyltransferase involved in cell wall biosynthesis
MNIADTVPAATTATARRPLRVAYIAPSALLDPASGASQSLMTMMASLARCGANCHALSATCFDGASHGAALPEFLKGRGLLPKGTIKGTGEIVWEGANQGVSQTMMHVRSQSRLRMTAMEELSFRTLAENFLKNFRPDVVVTYGGLVLDLELRRIAQRSGSAVVFYLANPKYQRRDTFDLVDLVITNSAQTAALYAARMKLRCSNVGLFVNPEPVIVTDRGAGDYVTFINPQPEKGVTLFLKLVEKAALAAPDMRFLVVESRAKLAPALEKMHLPDSIMARITLLPRQDDMREVYRQTRVLLMPSFWFEAAGRVLIEAAANGIPVIATNRGGIPETLAGGGLLLDIPESCIKNHWHAPDDGELEPWWSALHRLWTDLDYYRAMNRQALKAADSHSLKLKTQRVIRLFQQVVADARNKPGITQSN